MKENDLMLGLFSNIHSIARALFKYRPILSEISSIKSTVGDNNYGKCSFKKSPITARPLSIFFRKCAASKPTVRDCDDC